MCQVTSSRDALKISGTPLTNESNLPQNSGASQAEAAGASREQRDSQLSIEDEALALLRAVDVSSGTIAKLARNAEALKSRKVGSAIVSHPRTPRHLSIPLLRRMFTFDLMQVTLTPAVATDIKRAAEEQILLRIESLSLGEKISLARRASGRVAATLLTEKDSRVISVVLDNARLIEAGVVTALMKMAARKVLFGLVSRHEKWSQRREVQIALLRSEKTPFENAKNLAQHFSPEFLRDIVPEARKAELVDAARG